MRELESIPFQHDGVNYEIKVFGDILESGTFVVRAFKHGMPANPYSYSIELKHAISFENLVGVKAIDPLVAQAKSDIVNGTWENVQRLLQTAETTSNFSIS